MIQLTTETATATADADNTARIVESTIGDVGHIATLPVVAIEILRLTEDPAATANDLNQVVCSDPVLSTRILKVVNSVFYGLPCQIGSIKRAVLMLGINAVKNIAIASSLDKMFRGGQISPDFDARDLWTHSIAVGTGTRLLAETSDQEMSDEAFLAGLIHDVGILVEITARRESFIVLAEKLACDAELLFRDAERQVLGATHEDFGAALCREWMFPKSLEFVAGYHHRPMELGDAQRRLPALVHVADILAAQINAGYSRTVETLTVDPQILDEASLTENSLQAVTDVLPAAIEEAQQLLTGKGSN